MKNYIQPMTTVVSVAAHGHILDGASPVTSVSNNAEMNYGGGNNGNARVKENSYNVWDDDWKNQ